MTEKLQKFIFKSLRALKWVSDNFPAEKSEMQMEIDK